MNTEYTYSDDQCTGREVDAWPTNPKGYDQVRVDNPRTTFQIVRPWRLTDAGVQIAQAFKTDNGVRTLQAIDQTWTFAGLDRVYAVDCGWVVGANHNAHRVAEIYDRYANGQSWSSLATYFKAKAGWNIKDVRPALASDDAWVYIHAGIIEPETLQGFCDKLRRDQPDTLWRSMMVTNGQNDSPRNWRDEFAMPDGFDPVKFIKLRKLSEYVHEQHTAFRKSYPHHQLVKQLLVQIQKMYPEHRDYLLENRTEWLQEKDDTIGAIHTLTKSNGREYK